MEANESIMEYSLGVGNKVYLIGSSLVVIWLCSFIVKFVRHRRFYRDLPCPPHSFWTGNIVTFMSALRSLPPGAHAQLAAVELAKKHNLGKVFYIDLFPVAIPLIVIHDQEVAAQVVQEKMLPSHSSVLAQITDLIGSKSLSLAEGKQWKFLRSLLAPSFTPLHLNTWIPDILECFKTFQSRLDGYAETNEVFELQEVAAYLTADIIGFVVLGENFNSQLQHNEIVTLFRMMVRASEIAPLKWPGIGKMKNSLARKWYSYRLDCELARAVERRFRFREDMGTDPARRAVVDVEYDEYKRRLSHVNSDPGTKFDKGVVRDGVKNLLFGGHDNSAAALSYAVYLLTTHPAVLAEVRREHDEVYSKDLEKTLALIADEPKLLKQLPLTTACIQETLRLFPTGNIPREAGPGTYIQFEGSSLPCWGHLIWPSHYGIHRNDGIVQPTEFDPTRFLGTPAQVSERVGKDGWRPFEKGPRACLGQELAIMEMKMLLVVVLRSFDFEPAYEQDAPRASKEHGGQAYQTFKSAPKPASGMPMRVRRRSNWR